jgi:TRAP-type C4-dicarboxylate transport system permease small subunit
LREHINVPLLVNVLPPRPRRIAQVIAALVMIAFGVLFTLESWEFAAFSFEIGARSEQSQTPVGAWQSVMPLGIGLLTLIAALRLLMFLVQGASGASPDEPSSTSPL